MASELAQLRQARDDAVYLVERQSEQIAQLRARVEELEHIEGNYQQAQLVWEKVEAILKGRVEELEAESKSLLAREMLAQGRLNELNPVLRKQEVQLEIRWKRIAELEAERERLRGIIASLLNEYQPEWTYAMGNRVGYRCDWCLVWIRNRSDFSDIHAHAEDCVYRAALEEEG